MIEINSCDIICKQLRGNVVCFHVGEISVSFVLKTTCEMIFVTITKKKDFVQYNVILSTGLVIYVYTKLVHTCRGKGAHKLFYM